MDVPYELVWARGPEASCKGSDGPLSWMWAVQEGAGTGGGTTSSSASTSGKSTGSSEDALPPEQGTQHEQDRDTGILHGDLAESLKQDVRPRG